MPGHQTVAAAPVPSVSVGVLVPGGRILEQKWEHGVHRGSPGPLRGPHASCLLSAGDAADRFAGP